MRKPFAVVQNRPRSPSASGGKCPQVRTGEHRWAGSPSPDWGVVLRCGTRAAPADHGLGNPPGSAAESQVCFPITARQSPQHPSILQPPGCQGSWGLGTGLSLLLPQPGRFEGQRKASPDLVKSPRQWGGSGLSLVEPWLLAVAEAQAALSPRTVPGMALSSLVQTVAMHYHGSHSTSRSLGHLYAWRGREEGPAFAFPRIAPRC